MLVETVAKNAVLPLKWHGGKHYLADRILALFPKHVHYVETHFGSGAVLFAKPTQWIDGHSEVVNDFNGELMNFWRVLQSPTHFRKLRRVVEATPLAKPAWDRAIECRSKDPVARAVAFFIRFRQSRQGIGKDFATMSRSRTRRGMNEQVSSWLSAIEGLDQIHGRLKRVAILSDDAVDVIRREDSVDTLFYLDPPYLPETRTATRCYDHEMTEQQHAELLDALSGISGKFLLSGYRSRSYDEFAANHGWNRVDFPIDNKASSAKQKPTKVESVWLNF